MNSLEVRGLRKSYAGQEVVCGVDLEVAPGECFGLLGPNGAGKTTTLRLCLGLSELDAGEIQLLGHAVPARAREARVLIGLAFAALGLSVNALASGYDFFSYYMTLLLTPMMMLSGVFFPVERLPEAVQAVSRVMPLYHGVELVRPLLAGALPASAFLHLAVLAAYALAGFYLATVLTRRWLLT